MDEPIDDIGIDEIIANNIKPASKESLKVLSEKEEELKDKLLHFLFDENRGIKK